MKTLNEIRLEAAAILERDGWCQGRMRIVKKGRPTYCLMGACRVAAGYYLLRPFTQAAQDADSAALNAAIATTAVYNARPSDWNDHPDRTAREVIAALRAIGPRSAG